MGMRLAALGVTCFAALLLACGSDRGPGTGTDAGSGTDTGGGVCIGDDLECGPATGACIGDCRGRTCCSGLCAGELCAPTNVVFGSMCRDRCGGDAAGTWRVVGGCIPRACDGQGAIRQGTLTVAEDSTDSLEMGYDFHCGGFINTGGGSSIQGLWDPALPTIGGYAYCVDGDSLFITYRDDGALNGLVVELTRE